MLHRPHYFTCTRRCPKARHAKLRQLANAIEAVIARAEEVIALPEPLGDDIYDWYGIVADLQGSLWAIRQAASTLENATLACCHGDGQAREYLRRYQHQDVA